jgi:parvulin-like peptidyl-prolyl isomerase
MRRILLLVLASSVAACAAPPRRRSPVVAEYDGGEITKADLEARIRSLPDNKRRPPKGQSQREWKAEIVRQQAFAALLARAGLTAKLEARPEVAAALDRSRAQVLSAAAERRYILSKVHITPEDMRARFEQRRSNFSTPEMVRTRHIYLRVRPSDSLETKREIRARLEAIRQQAVGGARFAELAKRYSESSTAKYGGIVESSPRGTMDEDYERAAWALQKGEISPVVETRQGFHLIQLEQRVAPHTFRFEEVRDRIRRRLILEQTEKLTQEFIAQATRELGAKILLAQLPISADLSAPALSCQGRNYTLQDLWTHWAPDTSDPTDPLSSDPVAWARDAVRKEILLLKAEADGLASKIPEVAAQVAGGRTQVLSMAQLEQELMALEAELPAQQVRELYQRDRAQLQSPLLLSLRGIWLPFRDGVTRIAVRDRAEALAQKCRDGTAIEQLAAAAPQAGSFGWDSLNVRDLRQRTTPELAAAASDMGLGEVRTILIQQYDPQRMRPDAIGYAVIRLTGRADPHPLQFQEVESQLRRRLIQMEGPSTRESIRQRTLRAAQFRILETNL